MAQAEKNHRNKRVMIVEDSTMMRTIIARLISEIPGVAVVAQACHGRDALTKLKEARPDLILLDLEMPQMDGLTFLRHAKLRTRAPVIVLSSVAQAGSPKAIEARRLGATAVIGKPSGAVSMDLEHKRGDQLTGVVRGLLSI